MLTCVVYRDGIRWFEIGYSALHGKLHGCDSVVQQLPSSRWGVDTTPCPCHPSRSVIPQPYDKTIALSTKLFHGARSHEFILVWPGKRARHLDTFEYTMLICEKVQLADLRGRINKEIRNVELDKICQKQSHCCTRAHSWKKSRREKNFYDAKHFSINQLGGTRGNEHQKVYDVINRMILIQNTYRPFSISY